jgi:hypothetical protein
MRKQTTCKIRMSTEHGSIRRFDGRWLTDGKMAIDSGTAPRITIGDAGIQTLYEQQIPFAYEGKSKQTAGLPMTQTMEEFFSRPKGDLIATTSWIYHADPDKQGVHIGYNTVSSYVFGVLEGYYPLLSLGCAYINDETRMITVIGNDGVKIAIMMCAKLPKEVVMDMKKILDNAPIKDE